MKVQNTNCETITFESEILSNFLDYSNVTIYKTQNCCTEKIELPFSEELDCNLLNITTGKISFSTDNFLVKIENLTDIEKINWNDEIENQLNYHEFTITENIGSIFIEYRSNNKNYYLILDYIRAGNELSFSKKQLFEITEKYNIFTNEYTITPADLNQSGDTFCDGIYQISVEGYKDNGSKYLDTACHFINCKIKCLIASELLKKDCQKENLIMYWDALKYAEECENCNCTVLCELYKELLKTLGKVCNTEPKISKTCGCS